MIKISNVAFDTGQYKRSVKNVAFDTGQYKRSVKNVAIYGAKNNYWCREISVKKRRNTSVA